MDKNIEAVFRDIKSIKIQGATNVAKSVALALRNYARKLESKKSADFIRDISNTGKYLVSARVTEPMADNVVEFIAHYLRKNKDQDVANLKKIMQDAIDYFFVLVEQNERRIIQAGEKIIKFGDHVFTHCHSSTVINILLTAKKNKKNFEVFQTETRPLYQGHKTARDLRRANIKDSLVVDSAAPYLISKISGNKFNVDKVILGCDAIARDGSCVNKVGSFALALTAALNKIPVYIATQALKLNEDAKNLKAVQIEQREAREVWDKAPKGLKIYNPAFDKVPAELITGYITEFGLIKPKEMVDKVKKNYPWLW